MSRRDMQSLSMIRAKNSAIKTIPAIMMNIIKCKTENTVEVFSVSFMVVFIVL